MAEMTAFAPGEIQALNRIMCATGTVPAIAIKAQFAITCQSQTFPDTPTAPAKSPTDRINGASRSKR